MIGRCLLAFGLAIAAVVVAIGPAHAGSPADVVCVGGAGCYPTLQSAIDAAVPGGTVRVSPGTYAGGIVIGKDLTVVGAGAKRSIVKGGGPVVAVWASGATRSLNVTLRGLTVTGGLNGGDQTWAPERTDVMAPWGPVGGGILVSESDQKHSHASLTLVDCVVSKNVVRASQYSSSPKNAGSEGGGIAMIAASVTLIRTTVSDNVAGGGISQRADGGGIWNATGNGYSSLTIRDSLITRNRVIVRALRPDRANGAGINGQSNLTFSISNSVISDNLALLETKEPPGAGQCCGYWAGASGLELDGPGSATIESTRVTGNLVRVIAPRGDPNLGAAVLIGGPQEKLVIRGLTVSGNRVDAVLAEVRPGGQNCCPGAVVELDTPGDVRGLRITGNTQVLRALRGLAFLGGTFWSVNKERAPLVVADSIVAGNTVRATSRVARSQAGGGAIVNGGRMELRTTRIVANVVESEGRGGFARGGGVWNIPWNGSTPRLVLGSGTVVRGNVVRGRGTNAAGGGVFTEQPVTVRGARIRGNLPDDCRGCRRR